MKDVPSLHSNYCSFIKKLDINEQLTLLVIVHTFSLHKVIYLTLKRLFLQAQ